MAASNKVGTQLLVSPNIKARGQALALVRQESTAEVWRAGIEAILPRLESRHSGALVELNNAFIAMGIVTEAQRVAALQAMIDQKIRFGDLFLSDGSPRTVFPGTLKA